MMSGLDKSRENTGKQVAQWIKDNPGTGMIKLTGAADFPGDKAFVRYALMDRWGHIVAYVQKEVKKDV